MSEEATEPTPARTPAPDELTPEPDELGRLKRENETLHRQLFAAQEEIGRLRNVAFSLEVTAKTLASLTPLPALVQR